MDEFKPAIQLIHRSLVLLTLVFALTSVPAGAVDATATDKKTIVFVCLHGAANSQMAAAHFNKISSERDLPYIAVSRGIEAGTSIPTGIRDGLSLDGLEPVNDVPKPLVPLEAETAINVVAFDAVPDDKRGSAEVNYWSDVPSAIRGYADARDAIIHHIDNLVSALPKTAHAQETLQGVVTAIEERRDRMTVWLDSDVSGSFKVQDGLVFNAVQGGERVEITVEVIGGAKTIVGLKKL
jgi:arsenate reductase (thioredoxin)